MSRRGDWRHLVGFFVVALVLRGGLTAWVTLAERWSMLGPEAAANSVLTTERALLPDEQLYLELGRVITGKGEFQAPPWERLVRSIWQEAEKRLEAPQIDRKKLAFFGTWRYIAAMPLYPLMISALVRGFGDSPLLAIRLVQALLGSISCLLVYSVAAQFFQGRGRLWAGWLAAIWPFWVFFTVLVLTETLFIMLLLITWYLAARIAAKPTISDILMCGLFAAATFLTGGTVGGLFLLLVPVLVLVGKGHRRRALAAGAGVVLVLLIGISPWVARNYVITRMESEEAHEAKQGQLVLTTCTVGRSLYEAMGPEADGGPAMDKIQVRAELGNLTEYEVDQWYADQAWKAMKADPWRVVRLAGVKFLRTWSVVPNFSEYRRPFYMVVSMVSVIPVLVFAGIGLWLVRRQWRDWLLVILPVVYFTLLRMISVGSVRYRLPMMGFVIMLAGVGLSAVFSRFDRERTVERSGPDDGQHPDPVERSQAVEG